MRNTAEYRTVLSRCRKSELIACLDRLCAENERQQRSAQRRLDELERRASKADRRSAPDSPPGGGNPTLRAVSAACLREAEAQIELLTRKLAAAQAELRRYQTRLFAYERETLALRRENAEMEALCRKARACGLTAEEEVREPRAPALPQQAVEYPALRRAVGGSYAVAERTETMHCTQAPGKLAPQPKPWAPRTALEKLAAQLMEQMDRLMQA